MERRIDDFQKEKDILQQRNKDVSCFGFVGHFERLPHIEVLNVLLETGCSFRTVTLKMNLPLITNTLRSFLHSSKGRYQRRRECRSLRHLVKCKRIKALELLLKMGPLMARISQRLLREWGLLTVINLKRQHIRTTAATLTLPTMAMLQRIRTIINRRHLQSTPPATHNCLLL